MKNRIKQQPTEGFDWLYQDEGENRLFAVEVVLLESSKPWNECTDAEKVAWEEEKRKEQEERERELMKQESTEEVV